MKYRYRLIVVMGALALTLTDSAAAQGPAVGVQTVPATTGLASIPPEPHPFGELRFGKVTFAPTLRLSQVGVDTNVFSLDGSERQPPDFTATVQPGVEARLETNRAGFRLLGGTGLVYYKDSDFERAVNPVGQLAGFFKLGRKMELFGDVGAGYVREYRGFEIDIRPRVSSTNYGLGARLMGRRVGVELVARHGVTRYDERARYLGVPLNETLNRKIQSTQLAASYRLTPYTTFTLGAAATGSRFLLSPVRDTAANRGYIALAFHPRALVSGSLQVGYVDGNILSNQSPDFSGVTANGTVAYTWRDAFSVAIGAARDFDFSYRLTHPYFRYDVYDAAFQQALFQRFDFGGSVSQGTLSYPVIPGFADVPTAILRQFTGRLGVRLKSQLRIGVFVSRVQRTSADSSYKAYRSGLEATIGRFNVTDRGVFLNGVSR